MLSSVLRASTTENDPFNPLALAVVICGLLLGAAGVVSYLLLQRRGLRERAGRHREWARSRGLEYAPRDPMLAGLSEGFPFNMGELRGGFDVFRGQYRNRLLVFGEYKYSTVEYPQGRVPVYIAHPFQVVAVVAPGAGPFIDVMPKLVPPDVAALSGAWAPVRVVEEFHRRFTVNTSDHAVSTTLLDQPTMRRLIADPRAAIWPWRIEGPWLLSILPGNLDLSQAMECADFLNELLDNAPASMWR